VRDLELTVAALQADIRHLAEDLAAVTDGRDKRDKIILTLFRMLRKNLRERARLTVEMIEVKKKLLPPKNADGTKPKARDKTGAVRRTASRHRRAQAVPAPAGGRPAGFLAS